MSEQTCLLLQKLYYICRAPGLSHCLLCHPARNPHCISASSQAALKRSSASLHCIRLAKGTFPRRTW